MNFIISFSLKINNIKKRKEIDSNIFLNIKNYIKNNELIKAYLFSFMMYFHYTFIFVYMFLQINEIYGGILASVFLSVLVFPLIFIQFKMEYFLKNFKIKNVLHYSYIFLAELYICCFFVDDFRIKIVLLFVSTIHMAIIELIIEINFFEKINKNDEKKFYPIFKTLGEVGGLIGKVIISTLLLFLSFNYIFLLLFLLCVCILYFTFNK